MNDIRSDFWSEDTIRERIRNVWESAIGIRIVDGSKNFIELGGTSLLAAKVAVDLSDTFGRPITLIDVIISPSFDDFCAQRVSDNSS